MSNLIILGATFIIIIKIINGKNLPIVSYAKFKFSLSPSARAFAPSTLISFPSKKMTKWNNNKVISVIRYKN